MQLGPLSAFYPATSSVVVPQSYLHWRLCLSTCVLVRVYLYNAFTDK